MASPSRKSIHLFLAGKQPSGSILPPIRIGLVIHRYEEQEQEMADRQRILDYLQQWDQLPQDTPITPNISWILLEQAVGLSPSHRGFGSNPKLLSLLNLSSWNDWEEIDCELPQVQSRLTSNNSCESQELRMTGTDQTKPKNLQENLQENLQKHLIASE